jgi:hypothetical protein
MEEVDSGGRLSKLLRRAADGLYLDATAAAIFCLFEEDRCVILENYFGDFYKMTNG